MMINNSERVIAWESRTGIKLNQYEVLDSTNNRAKEYVKELISRGNTNPVREIFVCEKQTNGRGRRGKNWESPSGTGIWMSCLMTPKVSSDVISEITLLAALGVVKAINHLAVSNSILNIEPKIKWPNDIVINEKKNYQEDQKNYVSIFLDPKINKWFLSNGYTKQAIPSPTMHNMGDVVALFYCSAS